MFLEVKNLYVCYGSVQALADASFHVNDGEVVAMIGPNGAGKSSAVKAVAGLLDFYNGTIKNGCIRYNGDDITRRTADQLVRCGIAIVPEGRRIFGSMTVAENLEMGGYLLSKKTEIAQSMDLILDLFDPLKRLLKKKAGSLSGGEQQMLAIGRSLMLKPKLLIADEPSLGLSPNYVEIIGTKLKEIKKQKISTLLVEQNINLAISVSDRNYIFKMGKIVKEEITHQLTEKYLSF